MAAEIITVRANGMSYSAFRRVDLEHGFDEAALAFHLVAAAELDGQPAAEALAPGTALDIYFGADLACRGYTDRYQPRRDEHASAEVLISGRSKSQDFVDCAALSDSGQFKQQTLLAIAQKLDRFGIGVTSDQELEALDDFAITPGETCFRAVEKKLRSEGLTLSGQRDGSLLITKPGNARHAGALISGDNVLGESADLNWAHRHSQVIVRGQQADGHGQGALQVAGQAQDDAVSRYRPVVVVADDEIDGASAQERADMRLAREAGESIRASIKVAGFRDDAGTLWTPGWQAFLQSDFLGLAQMMLIQRAGFSQSREGGTTTVLDLVDPRAYAGALPKASHSRNPWQMRQHRILPQ
jgi:prophage tail gpP-like protein